jgi:hypothetical protein
VFTSILAFFELSRSTSSSVRTCSSSEQTPSSSTLAAVKVALCWQSRVRAARQLLPSRSPQIWLSPISCARCPALPGRARAHCARYSTCPMCCVREPRLGRPQRHSRFQRRLLSLRPPHAHLGRVLAHPTCPPKLFVPQSESLCAGGLVSKMLDNF